MPLGIMKPSEFSIQPEQIPLEEIQQLALYTDGVIEQTNSAGEAYSSTRINIASKTISR